MAPESAGSKYTEYYTCMQLVAYGITSAYDTVLVGFREDRAPKVLHNVARMGACGLIASIFSYVSV